jgi:uncharacterized protein YbjT (DUF2867 family)
MPRSVLLIGATGLVGDLTLRKLLEHEEISEVRVITRKTTGIMHEKLKELVIDFELLKPFKGFMQGDVFINCLGSTRKKAGSADAFERIDYFYPLKIATACKTNGTKKMILLSAMGANKDSRLLYPRVKGQLEAACEALDFEELLIVQPSILTGERQEKRALEKMAFRFMKMIKNLLPSFYRPVSGEGLANTIVKNVFEKCSEKVQRIRYKDFVL